MKKKAIIVGGMLLVITGCGKAKNELLGTWETKYEMNVFGEVKESYTFKEDNECVRIFNAGSDIIEECTYEVKDKEIKIVWDSKIDKKSYNKYVKIDENTIAIGNNKYTRKK